MIKHIASAEPHDLYVSHQPVYVNLQTGADGVGMVRATKSGDLEVWTGWGWQVLSTVATVSLSPPVSEAIKWAQEKMKQEREIQQYAERYPAVKLAKEKLDVVLALVRDEEKLGV